MQIERDNDHSSSFDSLEEGGSKEVKEEEEVMAVTSVTKGSVILTPKGPVSNEKDGEHASTYFVDAREPEPEELNSLLSDPLPPPG